MWKEFFNLVGLSRLSQLRESDYHSFWEKRGIDKIFRKILKTSMENSRKKNPKITLKARTIVKGVDGLFLYFRDSEPGREIK